MATCLFLNGAGTVQRVHGPFVSDEEVEAVTTRCATPIRQIIVADVLRCHEKQAPYDVIHDEAGKASDLYEQAVEIVLRDQKASTSYLQRRLSIGYNRAADLIDRMEQDGVISPADHAGRREILLAG